MAHRFSLTCALVLMLAIRECCGIQCSSHVVIIDASVGRPCKDLDFTSGDTKTVEHICSDLQSVLLLIAEHSSSSSVSGNTSLPCTELRVSPGDYVLTEAVKIDNHNVVIKAAQPTVTVYFNLTDEYNTGDAVLSIHNCDFVEITGVYFHNSPGVISLDNIPQVILNTTTFSYFSQGAVDIFNCQQVYAARCVFEHNGPVQTPRSQPFRGQAGGLSVGYNYTQTTSAIPFEIIVSNCTFYNNSAVPNLTIQRSRSNFQQSLFTGRGGGSSVILVSAVPVNVTFEHCTFTKNTALNFGGAVYISTQNLAPHFVTLSNSSFVGNVCPEAGGGVYYTLGRSVDLTQLYTFVVLDSKFIANRADYGGGLYIITGGRRALEFDGTLYFYGRLSNCLFQGNVAYLFGGGCACSVPNSEVAYQNTENVDPIHFEDCTFINNRGGALSTAFFPIEFIGNTLFERNIGQALVIAGALVGVHGTLEIINNDATASDKGAVYVTSFGQMELFRGAALRFINNEGNVGAALVLDNPFAPPSFLAKLLFNPLCFLLFETRTMSPLQISNDSIEISFSGSTAVIGSAVYARNLDLCSWTQLQEPYFNISAPFRWSFMQYSADNCNSAHVGDECNPKWHVQTPSVKLNLTSGAVVSAYPGEGFSVGVELYDELGELTADVLRLSDETLSLQQSKAALLQDDDIYALNTSVVSYDMIDGSGVDLSFNTLQQTKSVTSKTVYVNTAITGSHFSSSESFEVVATACPAGYLLSPDRLRPSSYRCQCNLNNTDIVNCDGRNIQLLEGLWAMFANDSEQLSLTTYKCPYQYCRCTPQTIAGMATCSFIFSELDADAQCNCNREGVLCGDCRDGRGVSVQLNRCVSCHNAYSLLIALLVVCDVVVFVALLLLLSEMPAWLYPCLFYLQILPYLTENFPLTFEEFQQPIYTVTGALSFYFVYDFCVYSSLSPLVSYFIRFIPFFTSLLVCPIVIVARKCLKKHRRHGLWWIILLQYPHIVYTAMSILNCPLLPGEEGQTTLRWYISGGVECFTGWHIPLAVLAVAVLALCVGLVPLAICAALNKKQTRTTYFTEPLVLLTSVKYKWWGAVELSRRLLVLLFIVAFPRNDLPVLLVLMLIIVLYGLVQPFTGKAGTALEAFLSVATLLLLLLRNTGQVTESLSLKDLPAIDNQSYSNCSESVLQTTQLAWLLSPLYYVPLVTIVLAACWWIVLRTWHLARTGQQEEMKATADDVELLSVSVHEATTDYYVRLSVPEDGASEQDSMHIKLEYVKL